MLSSLLVNRIVKGIDPSAGDVRARILAEPRQLSEIRDVGDGDESIRLVQIVQEVIELLFENGGIYSMDDIVGPDSNGRQIRLRPQSQRELCRVRNGVEIGARNTQIQEVHIGIAIFERFLDLEHVTVGEGRRSNPDRVAGPDGHIGEIAIEESAQIQVRRIWGIDIGCAGKRNIGSGRVEPKKVGEITGKIAKDVDQIGFMSHVFPHFAMRSSLACVQ